MEWSRQNGATFVLLKQPFKSHLNDPFAFRPKFWLLLSKVGLKTKIFGNGRGSFGWTGPTVQEDHLWRWTILTGKFLRRPKRPIYFSTEISENFVIMESTPYYSWCLKDEAFRADLYLHSLSRLQMRPSSFRLETRQVLVSVLSWYWISKVESLYYILIVSNCSALFLLLKKQQWQYFKFCWIHLLNIAK